MPGCTALTLELGQALSLPGFADRGDPLAPILAPGSPFFYPKTPLAVHLLPHPQPLFFGGDAVCSMSHPIQHFVLPHTPHCHPPPAPRGHGGDSWALAPQEELPGEPQLPGGHRGARVAGRDRREQLPQHRRPQLRAPQEGTPSPPGDRATLRGPGQVTLAGPSSAPQNAFVGLTNLGATCYVNTFLQMWFLNLELRQALYLCPSACGDGVPKDAGAWHTGVCSLPSNPTLGLGLSGRIRGGSSSCTCRRCAVSLEPSSGFWG